MDMIQAEEVIRRSSLAGEAELLIKHLLPSARVVVREPLESSAKSSNTSRFGGMPLLPHGQLWPTWDKREFLSGQVARLQEKFRANPRATGLRDIALRMRQDLPKGPVPLPFLGQLSLAEIHAAAPLRGWPSEGTLAFFCETSSWGFDPLARGHCRVFFFPPHEELIPLPAPNDLPDEARFLERALAFEREWTLPSCIEQNGLDYDEYSDLCEELMPGLKTNSPIHRCGGHAQEIQGEMRLECQLVTNGIYCGDPSGYQDPRRSILEKGAADWQLLLQVDSDEERLGWMWGDTGRVYFWARRQDIEVADFNGSWSILQCY